MKKLQKILIADNHRFVAEATRIRLSEIAQDAEFVFAMNVHELSRLADDTLSLAIVELNMPGAHGSLHVDDLCRRYPTLPVIVFSGSDDPGMIQGLFRRGVLGFIPKAYSGDVMLSAVRLVLAGGVYVPPLILPALLSASVNDYAPSPSDPVVLRDEPVQESCDEPTKESRNGPAQEPCGEPTKESLRSMLTERQMEVLGLLSQGKPNKLIGRALGINEGTVKIHLAAIYRVLNVSNRTEAAVKARLL